MRGRRQVGKSRLVAEWLRRSGTPHAFYTASRRTPSREVELFTREVAESTLPSASSFAVARPSDWDDALSLLAATHNPAVPAVLVVDELPYLIAGDDSIEATFQKLWDRRLSELPLLVILVGSDLGMMASLAIYDRPLYGRPNRELVISPLTPADVAALLNLQPADALDAYAVVGGFPGVVTSWPRGADLGTFLESALADPTAPLLVMGERSLAAEFPPQVFARRVLDVVGSDQRAFRAIGDRAGVSDAALADALRLLAAKGVVAVEEPLSLRSAHKLRRYRVADPYLRFWLRFIGPALPELESGRAHVAIKRMWAGWDSYRGVAVEPLIRNAIDLLLPDPRFGAATTTGRWWTRANDVEVDLVGVGRPAERIEFVGSVKWRDRGPFEEKDRQQLLRSAAQIPGADAATRAVGVSRSGFSTSELDVALGPEELLAAWES